MNLARIVACWVAIVAAAETCELPDSTKNAPCSMWHGLTSTCTFPCALENDECVAGDVTGRVMSIFCSISTTSLCFFPCAVENTQKCVAMATTPSSLMTYFAEDVCPGIALDQCNTENDAAQWCEVTSK